MKIFVYGTLKTHCCNHKFLKSISNGKPLKVKTMQKYPMYKSEYYFPYLVDKPGYGEYITGELYDIDEKFISKLDEFEGVPDLYQKGLIDVMCGSEFHMNVNCYFKSKTSSLEELENKRLLSEWTE
jgi:gamma-glutamylaminecyclotransferase